MRTCFRLKVLLWMLFSAGSTLEQQQQQVDHHGHLWSALQPGGGTPLPWPLHDQIFNRRADFLPAVRYEETDLNEKRFTSKGDSSWYNDQALKINPPPPLDHQNSYPWKYHHARPTFFLKKNCRYCKD